MPDWNSPEEIQRDAAVFIKLMHVLLGIYAYEWFLTLPFDWEFISGKKPFRWPMIFYFANRYLLLFAMIGIVIGLDTQSEIHCQALFTFNQLAGDAAVGLASINLAIRTMALWSLNVWVVGGLTVIILGHWSLILKGVLVTAKWIPGNGCVILGAENNILAAIFIYSMCFDFIVLVLSAYQLFGVGFGVKGGNGIATSRIGKLLFGDGLIFFLIAFLANLVATVFMLLNLNPIMSVIFNVPAAVFSTIVACWAVRRLTNFSSSGKNVVLQSAFPISDIRIGQPASPEAVVFRPGVHIQVESFTRSCHPPKQNVDYAHFEKRKPADVEREQTQGFHVQLTPAAGSSEGSGEGSGASSIDLEAKGSGF
jgi:hypothetical protein